MNWFDLPPSLLLAVFASCAFSTATPTSTSYTLPVPTSLNATEKKNWTALVPPEGDGPEYANACWSAQMSYSATYESWNSAHAWTSTTVLRVGGTSFSEVTYYENATTMCDGHARVTYSPPISLSTGTITESSPRQPNTTILGTYFYAYPLSAPTCNVKPKDCDGLWKQYSTLAAQPPRTTAPPLLTPPCFNQSAASSWASATKEIYGCGECTIYGEGVELVYFPTSVSSRDFCASEPTATLTHYGPSAVITAYAGKSSSQEGETFGNGTVWADGHVFTTGTAYISISTVYAVDRCSKTFGSPVNDAILAMPSESVLSLRYSQDHFQRVMETDKITGYPVSYADFNTPIPWSAWNGQNICGAGGYGGWACSIIYEHSFRPQLAIPPQITSLSPDFEGCQMWYNGLWDPPLALTEYATEAKPTLPGGGYVQPAETHAPASTPASPTVPPTALPNELPTTTATSAPKPEKSNKSDKSSQSGNQSENQSGKSSDSKASTPSDVSDKLATTSMPIVNGGGAGKPTLPADRPVQSAMNKNPCDPDSEPWVESFKVNGQNYWATGADRKVKIGGVTCTSGGPTETLKDGTQATYGNSGLILKGANTVHFGDRPDQGDGVQSVQIPQPTGGGGLLPAETTITAGLSPYIIGALQTPEDHSYPDTAVITIQGESRTVVQSAENSPIVVGGDTTLTPGGPATTLSDGESLSAASNALIYHFSSTLGVDEAQAKETGDSTDGRDGATSSSDDESGHPSAGTGSTRTGGAQVSFTGTASTRTIRQTSSTGPRTTSSGNIDSSTGTASNMSSSQALSLWAAVMAAVVVFGGT